MSRGSVYVFVDVGEMFGEVCKPKTVDSFVVIDSFISSVSL